MNTIDSAPDADAELDERYARLHRAGILDDSRRLAEPFRAFFDAFTAYQIHLTGDPDIVEQHRQAAHAAAPEVLASLGDAPAIETNTASNDNTTAQVAPTAEQPAAVEQPQEADRSAAPALHDGLGDAPVAETSTNVTDEPKAPETPAATDPEPIVETNEPDVPKHIGFDTHGLLRVRVADLKPNAVNATVFSSSLGVESIRELADDITRRKLRNPIEATPNLVMPDGQRRQLALQLLGEEETYVRVVQGIDTPERMEDYVWDSFNSARDAALDERVKLYQLAQKVIQRRHGRPRGRPSKKSSSNDELFWSPQQVKAAAAKEARFTSEVIADRAVSVFERADADLLAKVVAGEVTISAAYDKLSKPKSEKKKAKGSEDNAKKAKTKEADTEKPNNGESATGEDQKQQTQADDRPEEKPATQAQDSDTGSSTATTTSTSSATTSTGAKPATQAQEDQTSSSASEDTPSSTEAQEATAAATTEATRPSEQEQTSNPPDIKFEDALAVVMRVVRENDDDFAVKVLDQIATERDLLLWVRAGKSKVYRESLAEVVDQIVDEGLRTDAKATTRWARSLVEQVRSQLGDSDD